MRTLRSRIAVVVGLGAVVLGGLWQAKQAMAETGCNYVYDVNHDCIVDIRDVQEVVRSLGYKYSPSTTASVTPTPSASATASTSPTPSVSPNPSPSPSATANPSSSITSDANVAAYFQFEDSTPTSFKDAKNTAAASLVAIGTAKGGEAGKVGKAVRVNGVNNSLCSNNGTGTTCADANIYDFTANFSYAMWVKFDSNSSNNWLVRKWKNDNGSYVFVFDNSKFYASLSQTWPDYLFGYDKARPYTPKGRSFKEGPMTGLQDGSWNHIVVTRSTQPADYNLYINGALVATTLGKSQQANGTMVDSQMSASNQNSADPLVLGEFNGLLDEVVVYKKALTASEVTTLYNSYK